jgi:hypothetical protein
MINNKTICAKADLEVADLIGTGGYLQAEQADKFVKKMIEESVVLKMIKVIGMKSHTKLIDKIGINGWVLKPGVSGHALPEADRTVPTSEQVNLATHLMKGEIRLHYETLEDNIEGGTFKNTVMQMMAEHVALDMDKVAVNGDTTGTTGTVLDLMDGMLKGATSHIVNGNNVSIHKGMLRDAVKAMPSRYNRLKTKQKFLTSDDAETDYRDYLSDRIGQVSDKFLEGTAPVYYNGRAMIPVPVFPDNLGAGTDTTNILLTDPKNALWGFWRKVMFETDKDISAGQWIMVASVRAGFVWSEEDAVVKVTNVKTQ